MRKREAWMKFNAKVLAMGKAGTITKFNTNTIDGVEYIYQIYVRLDDAKFAKPYHPQDVEENTEACHYTHR